jgi:uncharacterized protein (TIGR03437 family)
VRRRRLQYLARFNEEVKFLSFRNHFVWPVLALCTSAIPGFAQYTNRYAVILNDSPVVSRVSSRLELQSLPAQNAQRQIEAAQQSLRKELDARHFTVTGSDSLLLNALFVEATPERVAEIESLPGVKGVTRLRKYKHTLNAATQLLNAPAAWSALGGSANAGQGIKVAVIDSGVDQNHPSLQDSSLPIPAGFPKCGTQSDCANFTNNKVIVARSYVRQLGLGTGTVNPAQSHPDDYSARDRGGHGTAVATCVAGVSSSNTVTIQGMAPKAYIGNYKIFGSPQVNDFATDDVIVAALSDAIKDGMDVITMSVGGPAFTGPLDTGAACGNKPGVACDISATAFENAAQAGALILVAAGNQGYNGWTSYPTFNSIASPADAPSVIAVGATTNSHGFNPSVRITGTNVPANLNNIPAQFTDSAFSNFGALAAPLVDVTTLGNDGYACASLPAGSLTAKFALIQRGPQGTGACTFTTKMTNAVNAGATGVVFYDYPGDANYPFSPGGLSQFSQMAFFLANSDGVNVKSFLSGNPGYRTIMDPAGVEVAVTPFNELAYYSSMGPATGTSGIKPDVLAVGGGGQNFDFIFMGTQSYDPLGDAYSATGYVAAAGTSFSTPLAAGAAAMVKQAHPSWSAQQIKSAIVNTATQDVTNDDSGDPVDILQTGGGKVAADLAIKTNVTVVPSTLSFGSIASDTLPKSIPFVVTNTSNATLNLALAVVPASSTTTAPITTDKQNLSLPAGASATVTATITGSQPAANLYYGAITIAGGSTPLRVPYMYLVPSTVAANFIPLSGDGNDVVAGQPFPDSAVSFKIVDANGAPIPFTPVNFRVNTGSAPVTLTNVSAQTDVYGIAYATATAGTTAGGYSIEGCLGACSRLNNFEYTFTGGVRNAPAITPGGIVSAAAAPASAPLAPGSYFSIYGTGLSDTLDVTSTAKLPLAIDFVNVSFDVPSAGISVPSPLVFVSNGQINAQVPWELQGQTSAQVKVILDYNVSNVITVPIANYAPAFFEYPLGSGVVAAVDPLNTSNPIITASNPVPRGRTIALYANGLGPVSNTPASGDVASGTNLSTTPQLPVVMIGGQNADVKFSGLTPGLPGLYQVNVVVPQSIGTGKQTVTIAIGGATSQASSITVQ